MSRDRCIGLGFLGDLAFTCELGSSSVTGSSSFKVGDVFCKLVEGVNSEVLDSTSSLIRFDRCELPVDDSDVDG